jgi:antitoxin component YwqK of YwqJK toxin-antitoxin module
MNNDLNIAEIFHNTGELKQRYSRYLSSDGRNWVRHGFFRAYHRNGQVASEGNYVHGKEEGIWRDYHENGHLAAEGSYEGGQEVGTWKTWNDKGEIECA